ncbi:MAG: DUF3999 family protein [Thiolinea sp.]
MVSNKQTAKNSPGPWWCQVLLVLFTLSLTYHSSLADSGQLVPDSFQFEAELAEGETTLRRVELSWEVLTGLQQQGHTDLQVYNADNQLVPFSVRQRNAVTRAEKTMRRELNFFSGDNAQHLEQLLANQQSISRRHLRALSADNRHYLIIPAGVDSDTAGLTSLGLEWQNLRQWLPKSLRVESSDDLVQWRSHAVEQLPFVLNERGVVLENRLIRLRKPVKSKFIRLSGGGDFAALLAALQQVDGYYQESDEQPVNRNWQTVALNPGEKPQQYRYDPPPAMNLLKWRLALPQAGYMYSGKLYSRRPTVAQSGAQQAKNDWHYRHYFQQYHLQTAAGVVRSAAESAVQLAGRQWLLEFDQPLTDAVTPMLEVAWNPLDVYFIAQGTGPFRLVYGSQSVKPVPAMQLDDKLMAGAETVSITQVIKLRDPVDPAANINWLAWLLWVVLAVSVVFLLWMAKRLWLEMNGKQGAEAE